MPTPADLRDLRATAGAPDTETFVFCTPCEKVTVAIKVVHDRASPVDINFKREARPSAADGDECRCDESGWVQFVHEGWWEFDNAQARHKKMVGEKIPPATPARTTYAGEDGEPDQVVEHDPWYGEEPTVPHDEIHDTPGVGQARVTDGPNAGARRKMFVTRYVCRKRGKNGRWEDGTHAFELRWSVYQHDEDGWTGVVLKGSRPTAAEDADAPCPNGG